MKKIDRYILSKYLSTFFFCLVLFTTIVVVIDLSEKTDDFMKSKLPVWKIFVDYHLGFIPRIDAMLFPLFVFIAVIFFTSKMAERSEIVAILSSGVSFRRFLFPYWIGGFILSLILWGTYHLVLPTANKKWGEFQAKYIDLNFGISANANQNYYFRLDSNSYAGIRSYDTARKSGYIFFVQRFVNNQMTYNLRADNIIWEPETKKWKLYNTTERFFTSKQKESIKFNRSLVMNYNFAPQDLRKDEYLKDRLPTSELDQVIKMERLRGSEAINSFLVERYNRDAIPVSVIVLTLIGAIMASRRVRGGSGLHLAIGVLLSVLYVLFGRFSLVFATKGTLTPLLAAWIPNIVFAILAFYLYKRAPK
ncbi:LptF/LptG family permease [Ferruginibacter sp. SUN002]|uniref:LptF/LptG family permease n=1 Tax=Ferruginibacter sp. SUN002 TaxID=2937789 RepID=UPI003D366CB2